ncbi:MAG: ferredoxin Fer [Haloarculaceae archaeon]
MARLEDVSLAALQDRLDEVESQAATRRLMVAVGAKQGLSTEELATWYGFDPETVEEWLTAFETEPLDEVVAEIERFELPGRSTAPVVRQPGVSRVTFLDYEVVRDMGWDVDDDDLFAKAHDADLSHEEYGRVAVERGETVLDAVEDRGYEWPYACRGGACSNCAVLLKSGEIAMPGQQILPEEAIERGARLTCVGVPVTERVDIVYNAKYVDFLDELRLPPGPFEQSRSA